MSKMKNCPFCAEEILSDAIKCKHCGSNIVADKDTEKGVSNEIPGNSETFEIRDYRVNNKRILVWVLVSIISVLGISIVFRFVNLYNGDSSFTFMESLSMSWFIFSFLLGINTNHKVKMFRYTLIGILLIFFCNNPYSASIAGIVFAWFCYRAWDSRGLLNDFGKKAVVAKR